VGKRHLLRGGGTKKKKWGGTGGRKLKTALEQSRKKEGCGSPLPEKTQTWIAIPGKKTFKDVPAH